MQEYSRGKIGIINCLGGEPFGKKVAAHLETILKEQGDIGEKDSVLLQAQEMWFANGEGNMLLSDSPRNEDIYIIQDVANSTTVINKNKKLGINDHYEMLKTAIDTAKRSHAHHITAVIPYFPYSRQDRRKRDKRESISAKRVAEELENAGANRITLDVHNESIEGFFKRAEFENLRASTCQIPYLINNVNLENTVMVAPDEGSIGRNTYFANILKIPLRACWKERDYSKPNAVETVRLLGEVSGKNCIVDDDMIDTAGTIVTVAQTLKDNGANDIILMTSLPIFSKPAVERLAKAYETGLIKQVIGTDAIYHGEDFCEKNPWYVEVSVAKYFAEAIYRINKGRSMKRLNESYL
jgi:ribose-phosphate pyrophosphokinase